MSYENYNIAVKFDREEPAQSPEPKHSALLCWPVEFLDRSLHIPRLHVTAAYFPDVRTYHDFDGEPVGHISKKEFLCIRGDGDIGAGAFRVAKVTSIDAFGPDEDVPVLRVSVNDPNNLSIYHRNMVESLNENRISYSSEFEYQPHVTVPLKVLVNAPTEVLLRPLELWYCDDEPVVV